MDSFCLDLRLEDAHDIFHDSFWVESFRHRYERALFDVVEHDQVVYEVHR